MNVISWNLVAVVRLSILICVAPDVIIRLVDAISSTAFSSLVLLLTDTTISSWPSWFPLISSTAWSWEITPFLYALLSKMLLSLGIKSCCFKMLSEYFSTQFTLLCTVLSGTVRQTQWMPSFSAKCPNVNAAMGSEFCGEIIVCASGPNEDITTSSTL